MRQQVEAALTSVPFLATLGLSVEEARPGKVLLRLPLKRSNTNANGDLHGATLLLVGETAAAVALATQPDLATYAHFVKASQVQYKAAARADVTAEVRVTSEMVSAVRDGVAANGKARLEVPVEVLDGKGREVAVVNTVFSLKAR